MNPTHKLNVSLKAVRKEKIAEHTANPNSNDLLDCQKSDDEKPCCWLPLKACPLEAPPSAFDVKCYCKGHHLCNKRESYVDKSLVQPYISVGL